MFQDEIQIINQTPREIIDGFFSLDPSKRWKTHRLRQIRRFSEQGNRAYYEVKASTGELFILKKLSKVSNIFDILNTITEIQFLSHTNHRNICKCLGYNFEIKEKEVDKEKKKIFFTFYLVLEHGEILEEVVKLKPKIIDASLLRELISSMLSVGLYLNRQKITHEDIRPDFITFTEGVFKLFGFGEGVLIENVNEEMEVRAIKGDIDYLAPENYILLKSGVKESNNNRFLCDVFSLGLTFIRIALSKHITDLNNPENPKLTAQHDQNLQKLVLKYYDHSLARMMDTMLILNPRDRPNCVELVDYLTGEGEFLEGQDLESIRFFENEDEYEECREDRQQVDHLRHVLKQNYIEIQNLKKRLRNFEIKVYTN